MNSVLLVLCTVFISLVVCCTTSSPEVQALRDIYYQTQGRHWEQSTNWLEGDPCANNWYGLTCNQECHVVTLNLESNGLIGFIPFSIVSLNYLETLNLADNQINGKIPKDLPLALKVLNLSKNSITGSIPYELSILTNLVEINLSYNELGSEIPDWLQYLGLLETLLLNDNHFSGVLPVFLSTDPNFSSVDLKNNEFLCPLPDWCSTKGNGQCEPCFYELLGRPLIEPPEVRCYDKEISLVLEKQTVQLDSGITLTTRVYNNSLPGPTIRMKAGATCKINLVNKLPLGDNPANVPRHNNFQLPDVTNLHTHGLHVSPEDDNINSTVLPGEALQYQYRLKEDVLMGTHWYHAHYHGSTTLQVQGGAFGSLLVDPSDNYRLPKRLKKLYDNEIVMALNDFDFRNNTYSEFIKSWYDITTAFPYQTIPPNIDFSQSTIGTERYYAVNGQYVPHINVPASTYFLIRFIHASAARSLELLTLNNQCQMMLLARDGVFHQAPYLQISTLVLLPATRADVVFFCPEPGLVTFGSHPQTQFDNYFKAFFDSQRVDQGAIFQFNVFPNRNPSRLPFPTSAVQFPHYLSDLIGQPIHDSFYIQMAGRTVIEPVAGYNASQPGFVRLIVDLDSANPIFWNGWENPIYAKVLEVDTLYEINLLGSHPHHQHINHFQVSSTIDTTGEVVRVGEFRDTVFGGAVTNGVPFPETVLMKTYEYTGYYMLHCHITEHEDEGLMSAYWVNPKNTTSAPVSTTVDSQSSLFSNIVTFLGNIFNL